MSETPGKLTGYVIGYFNTIALFPHAPSLPPPGYRIRALNLINLMQSMIIVNSLKDLQLCGGKISSALRKTLESFCKTNRVRNTSSVDKFRLHKKSKHMCTEKYMCEVKFPVLHTKLSIISNKLGTLIW